MNINLHDTCFLLAKSIDQLAKTNQLRPTLVSIDGRAGSGKTTLSRALQRHLLSRDMSIFVVSLDLFWMHYDQYIVLSQLLSLSSPQCFDDYEYDWRAFESYVLLPLFSKTPPTPLEHKVLALALDGINKPEASRSSVVIVEGVTSQRRELRDYYDIRIFTQAKDGLSLSRAIDREGPDSARYYEDIWKSKEDHYLAHHIPSNNAHFHAISQPAMMSFEIIANDLGTSEQHTSESGQHGQSIREQRC